MTDHLRPFIGMCEPRAIPDLSLPSSLRLLVLAPHPDDFDAIGVTLRFLTDSGIPVSVGVCRTGSGVDDSYRPGLSLADKADLREREQRDSARFFGLPEQRLTFLSLSMDDEDQPLDNLVHVEALHAFVSAEAPDVVFLPHGNDTNSGHRSMYSLFRRIARSGDRPLVALLNRDPKTISMRIDLYMPFGSHEADWKARLLRFHDSQHQRNLQSRGHGFDERILETNREIALELPLDAEYAEAFEVEVHNSPESGDHFTEH